MNVRQSRIATLIQRVASENILEYTRLHDHEFWVISVIQVEVTSDYSHAGILISSEKSSEKLISFLKPTLSKIRKIIAWELQLRITPELRFRLRKKGEHSTDILSLIQQLDKQYDLSEKSHP